jgi:uncharacterized membrane protein
MERFCMSEEGGFGIALAERFFGLLLVIVGAITLYYTLTSMDTLGSFVVLFGLLDVVLIVIGLVLITAKTE